MPLSPYNPFMQPATIADLLAPFSLPLTTDHLRKISTYIDLLMRWNARTNLTAIRDEESIVTRHFGESLFCAMHLRSAGVPPATVTAECSTWNTPPEERSVPNENVPRGTLSETSVPEMFHVEHLIDVGSGAGFPGIPIKLWLPALPVTLIESNNKKVTFLREVIRALGLTAIEVFPQRAEAYKGPRASIVTLRAVERFDQVLPTAASLLQATGRLALLIGEAQVFTAQSLFPRFTWQKPTSIPLSINRVLLIGTSPQ